MTSRRPVTFIVSALIAGAVLCVGQAASAARSARQSAPPVTHSASAGPSSVPAPPAAPSVVLYDQYNNQAASSITSQDFDAAYDAFDSFAADDFVVPVGQSWSITGVDADGEYQGAGPAASVNLFFYTNGAGNLPGTLVASRLAQTYSGTAGDFGVTVSPAVVLTSGTYWVSVQARQNFAAAGQWFWHNRAVQSNQGSAWQNPPDGFGHGCTTWTRKTACAGLGDATPDQVFRLNGTTGPTAVRVTSFAAKSTARGVLVHWRTAAAPDVLGFEVWRQRGAGPLRKATQGLIPGSVGGRASAYSFVDAHVSRGVLYRYRLQLVTLSGARYWAGTATVRMPG